MILWKTGHSSRGMGPGYLKIVQELYEQLRNHGHGIGYLGKAATLVEKTIIELNETIDMGLDDDKTARQALARMIQREKSSKGAKAIEVEIVTTPELKIAVTNRGKIRPSEDS